MKLEIKPISQRDSKYALKRLGTSSVTIGNYGCLLTCHCMMLNYYGKDFTVDSLNEFYKSKGVFDQGNLINFWEAANCFEDITADEYINCYTEPALLEKIDKYLAEGKPVITLVDFDPKPGIQTHFVLIIGKENDYLLNDPWTGETYFFTAKYGSDPAKGIFGLRLYSGKVPIGGETVESLLAQVESLSNKLATEITSNAELRKTIVRLQGDLAETDKQNTGLVGENRKLVIANEKATGEVEVLQRAISSADDRIKTLLEHVKRLENYSIEGLDGSQLLVLAILRLIGRR